MVEGARINLTWRWAAGLAPRRARTRLLWLVLLLLLWIVVVVVVLFMFIVITICISSGSIATITIIVIVMCISIIPIVLHCYYYHYNCVRLSLYCRPSSRRAQMRLLKRLAMRNRRGRTARTMSVAPHRRCRLFVHVSSEMWHDVTPHRRRVWRRRGLYYIIV